MPKKPKQPAIDKALCEMLVRKYWLELIELVLDEEDMCPCCIEKIVQQLDELAPEEELKNASN